MEFTKPTLKNFRADFEKAVAGLEKTYDMKLSIGNISFGATQFTTRLTGKALSETGEVKVDTEKFRQYKNILGFKFDLGDTFVSTEGKQMTIVDYNDRRSKNPIVLSCTDGKRYISSIAMVEFNISRSKTNGV